MSAVLFFAIFISASVGLVTARSISGPLRRLLTAVQAMRRGDLSQRVVVTSTDESAELARAINRMAEELQATTVSRGYVQGIIHSMSESLIVVSTEGEVATVNPAACALLGYRETELVGLGL